MNVFFLKQLLHWQIYTTSPEAGLAVSAFPYIQLFFPDNVIKRMSLSLVYFLKT